MVKSSVASTHEWTVRETRWPYDEYYLGGRDQKDRRNGQGENHWTGAESIEWYTGQFLRDTMHGEGDYRWRYQDPDGAFTTYEGRFFANQMHGYGMMSYSDGRVFTGLFYKDVRWGPGLYRSVGLRCNVGLWKGNQLARLTWCPPGPSITPDFNSGPKGPAFLDAFRVILAKNTRIIGQTNSALELLKNSGCDPQVATQLWPKLYPESCNDLESALCYKDAFERHYYKGKVNTLEEISEGADGASGELIGEDPDENKEITQNTYFAWNNNEMIRHMMKHCYKHENQRDRFKVDLDRILNGPRKTFRPAGKHEYDCRTLLMASYLGYIKNVAQLINNEHVCPDISDMQGNTALMYAVCGDQTEIIHFLVEAGASVNSYNDSCCTPLGMAIIRYLCIALDISPTGIVQSLLPPAPAKADKTTAPEERKAAEWLIKREQVCQNVLTDPTKLAKSASIKKMKSVGSLGKASNTTFKKKVDRAVLKSRTSITVPEYNSDDDVYTEEKRVFKNVAHEYDIRVNDFFMNAPPAKSNMVNIFQVNDMMIDIEAEEELLKAMTTTEKHPRKSTTKIQKEPIKGKDIWENLEKDVSSMTSGEKIKMEMLSKIQLTILQLFADGADPKMVRCPQPAILLAIKSGSPELVQLVVAYGVDINEKFPEFLDYTALDMVISEPFTLGNIEIIRNLLEIGADVHHQLRPTEPLQSASMLVDVPGPTLMHAVLAKRTEFDFEEEMRGQVLELLLRYNADPNSQYNGRSPIDIAMLKRIDLLDVFIKSGCNLNTIINDKNQTILVKMFSEEYFKNPIFSMSADRVPILTNLLLYGADPLIECYDGEARFGNIFEYAKNTLNIIAPPPAKQAVAEDDKPKGKGKNGKGTNGKDTKGKPSKDKSKLTTEVSKKNSKKDTQETYDYLEALDLMRECARLLHIRWLQAKLVKELTNVIYKYKHRPWNMIIKEHRNGSNVGLWLTTLRCLEIWEVLKTTKRKQFNNERILKHLLCIVQFYQKRLKAKLSTVPPMTAIEKNTIESDVGYLIKEHKHAAALAREAEAWKKLYAKPELDFKADNKFQVCFECSLRLTEESIICDNCELVSFCNLECFRQNIERANCHPCSELEYLKEKYFPAVE